jgi:hypothetical protein
MRENRFSGLGCSLIDEPKKMPSEDEHVAYAPGKNPPPNFFENWHT